MQFSAQTLLPYASGALAAWDTPAGICLRRLTPRQLQQFEGDHGMVIRSRCNAGIALEMRTDAQALEMDFSVQAEAPRPYGYIEVFVDGAPFAAEGSDAEMPLQASLRLALPGGVKAIEILLPALHEMAISHFALRGETCIEPIAHRFRYLAFGDSISQGYDAIFSSRAYPMRIAREIDALLLNQAVGGDVFRAEFPEALPGFVPDIITVAYGTNDWNGRDRADFEASAAGFFQNLHSAYPDAPVLAITPIWRADGGEMRKLGPFGAVGESIRRECAKYGYTVVDGLSLVPHDPKYFRDEYLHPNMEGFDWYFANLTGAVRQTLKIE